MSRKFGRLAQKAALCLAIGLCPAICTAAEDGPPSGASGSASDSANDPGQTLAQALQTNYGLKLEAKKNPADIVVIDHAEKVPTEN